MREPDLTGVAKAWRIRQSPEVERAHVRNFGHPSTGLATWIVNGPYHPFWNWWHIALIHLRDVPGIPPANKQYPEAEFELLFASLNPDGRNGGVPDVDKLEAGDIEGGMPGFLQPFDLVFQFHKVSDAQAIAIAEHAVHRIVAGQSCDSDFRSWWMGALARTVEHYVLGLH